MDHGREKRCKSHRSCPGIPGLGILIVLVFFLALGLFLYLLSHRKQRSRDALYDCGTFLAAGAILALLPCCHTFWHLLNRKVTLIQFPARLFLPASILILFAYATAVAEVNPGIRRSSVFNTMLCVLGAAVMALTIYPDASRNSNDDVPQQVKKTTKSPEPAQDRSGSPSNVTWIS